MALVVTGSEKRQHVMTSDLLMPVPEVGLSMAKRVALTSARRSRARSTGSGASI